MTTNLPLPSAQIASRNAAPKMRFLYPLAAICVAMVMLSPSSGVAQTSQKLRPDQERVIELAIAGVDPSVRAAVREQLAVTLASLGESQTSMLLAQMQAGATAAANTPTLVAETLSVANPQDLAFNKAQFEPVIRNHHDAQERFDRFANAKLAAHCPSRHEYARFGAAWRYEQGQFVEPSALASWNVEMDVSVAGEAYAPQDGRYRFDFSKVRLTFDESAVDEAIKVACNKVNAAGRDFLAKVDPVIARQDWNGAFKLEQWAQGRLEPIRAELQAKFDMLSPGDFTEIQRALMNGRRAK